MSQFNKETLSALLDNEADELELRRLLKASESDPELLATWSRYSQAQSALHGSHAPVSASLSEAIAARLETESFDTTAPTSNRFLSWQQSLTKVAIAASVAVAFFLTLQTGLDSDAPVVADRSAETVPALNSFAQDATVLRAEVDSAETTSSLLRDYLDLMYVEDPSRPAPVHLEHLQDSPLYRLVNEYGTRPIRN